MQGRVDVCALPGRGCWSGRFSGSLDSLWLPVRPHSTPGSVRAARVRLEAGSSDCRR